MLRRFTVMRLKEKQLVAVEQFVSGKDVCVTADWIRQISYLQYFASRILSVTRAPSADVSGYNCKPTGFPNDRSEGSIFAHRYSC